MLFVFLVSIVIMRYIEKILHGNQYLNVIRIFALAIMINIMIFIFLVNTFDKIKFKQGIRGPQGNRGDQGYQGQYDKCAVCGPQPQTVGYIKTEKMKRELVIPKKPNIVGEKYTEREQYILKPEEKPIEKTYTAPIIKKCDTYATYNPGYEFHRYSSIWGNNRMGTAHARGKLYSPQAWSAGRNSQGQWFEIRSDQKMTVMGVIVQPRGDRYSYQKVTSFKVKYSLDRSEYLDDKHMSDVDDGKIFNNSNNKYNFKVLFDNPVECYSIRIYPTKWKYHISMRAALLVCGKWDKCATEGNAIKEIGSYGDTRSRALRYGPRRYGYDAKKCSATCKNYKYFALQKILNDLYLFYFFYY